MAIYIDFSSGVRSIVFQVRQSTLACNFNAVNFSRTHFPPWPTLYSQNIITKYTLIIRNLNNKPRL